MSWEQDWEKYVDSIQESKKEKRNRVVSQALVWKGHLNGF